MANFVLTAGNDSFVGGNAVADLFQTSIANLGNADLVTGGLGATADVLQFLGAGTIAAAQFAKVSQIEQILLANGSNSLALSNALAASANNGGLIVTGNAGSDIIDGSLITTASARIVVSGAAGNDTLKGGAGNDVLDGGTGSDAMAGGAGNDSYVVDVAGDAVTEAGGGTDLVSSAVSYTLGANLENLTLTGVWAVGGTGNSLANTLTGNGADNALRGGIGNDVLNGLAGNDTLDGGSGGDLMAGGLGNDTYVVDSVSDVTIEAAGQGTDTVKASVTFALAVNVETLTLTGTGAINGTGNELDNTITGNAAANGLDGGLGADTLIGGAGDDRYLVDSAGDTIVEAAGQGTDLVTAGIAFTLAANLEHLTLSGGGAIAGTGNVLANLVTGNGAANTLNGLDGNDTLLGALGNDGLFGGLGDDTLDGGGGVDSMAGGSGNDIYVVDAHGESVVEAAGEGTDLVRSIVSLTLGANVENLSLAGVWAVSGTGNALNNVITGNAATNALTGGAGDDTLDASLGDDSTADSLAGGTGNDTYVLYQFGSDTATEAAGAGTDTIRYRGFGTFTLAANFENLVLLGDLGGSGAGNAAANAMTGNAGANVLAGSAGNDVLQGGGGDDQLTGGTGTDSVDGGAGNDRLIIHSVGGVADLTAGETYAGGAGTDTLAVDTDAFIATISLSGTALTGIEALQVSGYGAVVLTAAQIDGLTSITAGVVQASTGGVIDLRDATLLSVEGFTLSAFGNTLDLSGLAGGFTVTGLAGADTVFGGNGANTLNGGGGHDSLTGGNGADVLKGSTGNDALQGGEGDDTLTGGAGIDTVIGGHGNDTLHIHTLGGVAELAAGEIYNGWGGTDTLVVDTDVFTAAINLSGVTLTSIEQLEASFYQKVRLTAAQLDDLTSISALDVEATTGGTIQLGDASLIAVSSFILSAAGNTLALAGLAGGFIVAGAGGTDVISGGNGGNTLNGNGGNDGLTGGTAGDWLDGGAADDGLQGGDGGDSLTGGTGTDTVNGGLGDDTLYIHSTGGLGDLAAGEIYNGGDGTDTLAADIDVFNAALDLSAVTLIGIESLQVTINYQTVLLTAAQLDGLIAINAGHVEATTGGTIDLRDGTGIAVSSFTLSAAGNLLDLSGQASGFTVHGGIGFDTVNGGNGGNSLSGSNGNDVLTGSASDDTLDGGRDLDMLQGGAGNDTIIGGANFDIVHGGDGDDTFVVHTVGSTVDLVAGETYNGGAGTDTLVADVDVFTAVLFPLAGVTLTSIEVLQVTNYQTTQLTAVQLDGLTSISAIDVAVTTGGAIDLRDATSLSVSTVFLSAAGNTFDVSGRAGGFTVTGGAAADTIRGGDGANLITGGGGADTLSGGTGADAFIYASTGHGGDTITNFSGSTGQGDQLRFVGLLSGTFDYRGSGAFTATGNSEARFTGSALQVDTNGDGSSDLTLTLTGITTAGQLGNADFSWT